MLASVEGELYIVYVMYISDVGPNVDFQGGRSSMSITKTQRISTTEARKDLSDVVNRAAYGEERVLLTRYGEDVACLISMEEVRLLELLEDRMELEHLTQALERVKASGSAPWAELKEVFGW